MTTTRDARCMTTSTANRRNRRAIRTLAALGLLSWLPVRSAAETGAAPVPALTPSAEAMPQAQVMLPDYKPVAGTPVSMWWSYRTGNFKGGAQIWGEVRNDSEKRLEHVRVRFSSTDESGTVLGTHSDSVTKLGPGETWSFEIRPKQIIARKFELKDVQCR